MTQEDIARRLEVGQATVSRDITAVKLQYRAERQERIDQDAAILDSIEQECAVRYQREKAGEWIDRRLRVHERRAKLLGLDAPAKIDQRSEVIGSVRLGWDDGPTDTYESEGTEES